MHTERFRQLRKDSLSGLFDKDNVANVWRQIVRNQLRNTDIKDLFDHYDFNYNISSRAATIRNEILDGTYRVSRPLIYRLEKKFGVCRHMIIPQPADALVMQILVESLAPDVLKSQPSNRAFFSRDKHNIPKPHEAAEYGLGFRQQWKKLQKEIYRFNDEKELLVVTDLANYYDSIDMNELRNVFVDHTNPQEVVLDILFKVMQEISWQPDYLPYRGRGLPTTNLEAVRMLAHSFLFEVDKVLDAETNNSMVRWMDDFVIGVDSRKQAIEILSKMSDMLKSRGLALNLSKTAIYNDKDVRHNFQIDENLYLDSIEGLKKGDENWIEETTELRERFRKHLKETPSRYWEKVAKRYITALGRADSPKLLTEIVSLYVDYPSLRTNLIIYLAKIGYSKRAAEKVKTILSKIEVFDDISLNQISQLITQWEVPTDESGTEFVEAIRVELTRRAFARKNPADFHALLWFKAKYDDSESLYSFINKYQNLWQTDSFLRRQVTAALSRLMHSHPEESKAMIRGQLSSGLTGTISLANQLQQFRNEQKLNQKIAFYIFPKNKQRPYPLPKFMVLCSLLASDLIRGDETVQQRTIEHIYDPWFRLWLEHDYGIL